MRGYLTFVCKLPRMGKAKIVTTGVQEARRELRQILDAAANEQEHTVIQRRGKPVAVVVPVSWYIAMGGDPREPLEQLAASTEQRRAERD